MNDPLTLVSHSPEDAIDWERYYLLRWRVLREPWGKPPGSERDQLDATSFHFALWSSGDPVAAGRLHLNTAEECQIRYMAVDMEWRGKGLGGRILGRLEKRARQSGALRIVLNAREEAFRFYLRHGYHVTGPAPPLFGIIPHLRMERALP